MYERRELAWMYRAYRMGAAQGRWFVNTERAAYRGPPSREGELLGVGTGTIESLELEV